MGFPVGLLLGNPISGTLGPLEEEGRTSAPWPACTTEGKLHQDPRPRLARWRSRRRWLPEPERDPFRRWQSVEITYWRAGVVAYRDTKYGPDEGPIPERKAGTRRGGVTDWSRMGGKRFAILTGRWLAGEPEPVLFVTLTLGPEWEGFDSRGSVRQSVEWLRRHGCRGIALIGTRQRDASCLHFTYSLETVEGTGFRPVGWYEVRPRELCHKARTAKPCHRRPRPSTTLSGTTACGAGNPGILGATCPDKHDSQDSCSSSG